MRSAWLCVALALAACQRTHAPSLVTVTPSPRPGAPRLVVLHGYGADERDLLELGAQLAPRFEITGVRAPLPLPGGGYAWFRDDDGLRRARDEVITLLDAQRGRPVVLLGFSQGAMVTIAVTQARPELVAAGIAIGAGRLRDLSAGQGTAHLLLQHGTRDRRVPYAEALPLEAGLRATGADVTLHGFDADHQITPAMLEDARAWLKARGF